MTRKNPVDDARLGRFHYTTKEKDRHTRERQIHVRLELLKGIIISIDCNVFTPDTFLGHLVRFGFQNSPNARLNPCATTIRRFSGQHLVRFSAQSLINKCLIKKPCTQKPCTQSPIFYYTLLLKPSNRHVT